jgi:Protein of unknown function (DUF3489)
MTTTDPSKAQLATILSALDERPRTPANRTEALKAIDKSAQRYGLGAEDVLAAAAGLLDGRLSPAEFRDELQDLAGRPAAEAAEAAPVGSGANEPAPAGQEPAVAGTAREPAQAPQDGHDDEGVATGSETTQPATAAAQAPTSGEGRAKTPGHGRHRERTAAPAATGDRPTPREGTKQALLISMLRRPDGATVEEVVEATGWQKHTVRGAISGALKKKLSLDVTSDKVEGRGRVYRIAGADAAS